MSRVPQLQKVPASGDSFIHHFQFKVVFSLDKESTRKSVAPEESSSSFEVHVNNH